MTPVPAPTDSFGSTLLIVFAVLIVIGIIAAVVMYKHKHPAGFAAHTAAILDAVSKLPGGAAAVRDGGGTTAPAPSPTTVTVTADTTQAVEAMDRLRLASEAAAQAAARAAAATPPPPAPAATTSPASPTAVQGPSTAPTLPPAPAPDGTVGNFGYGGRPTTTVGSDGTAIALPPGDTTLPMDRDPTKAWIGCEFTGPGARPSKVFPANGVYEVVVGYDVDRGNIWCEIPSVGRIHGGDMVELHGDYQIVINASGPGGSSVQLYKRS